MSLYPNTVPSKRLAASITSSATSFRVNNILGWDGNALTSADFGTVHYVVFRNAAGTLMEIMQIDPSTIASASITINLRGLDFEGNISEVSANKLSWLANETIVEFGSHPPQLFRQSYVDLFTAQTVAGVKTFSVLPVTTAGNPVSDNEFARKAYVDASVAGGSGIPNRVVVSGKAGETLAAGNLVYLKASDNRWWLCDADTAATVDNASLGIAQGAGTAGNAITSGVLIYGVDSNQTGLTADTKYFASNTAGGLSTSAGTTEVSVGMSISTTSIFFCPRFDQVITEDLQDAFAGTSGTPSNSNKFVTNDDTASAATASKIARRNSTGDVTVTTTPTASTDAASKAYVDTLSRRTFKLGESFTGATTPQPAVLINDLFQPLASLMINVGTNASEKVAVKIIPRRNVTASSLTVCVNKASSPTDNLKANIYSDSAGNPNAVITNGTSSNLAGGDISGRNMQTFTYTPFSLVAGTTYWVVFERSSSLDDTNYFLIQGCSSSLAYGSFTGLFLDSTWQAANIASFEIIPSSGGGSISAWQSDANATCEWLRQCMGMIITTGSAGDDGTLITEGPVTGLSSLLTDVEYFVSTTKGAISALATSQQGVFLGTADSATSLNLGYGKKIGTPISLGAVGTNTGSGMTSAFWKAPCDGTVVVTNSSDATVVTNMIVTVYDGYGAANSNNYYFDGDVNGQRNTLSVPVSRGQMVKLGTAGAGSATVTFTPII